MERPGHVDLAVHEPLISTDDYQQAQQLPAAKKRTHQPAVTVRRTRHPYQLRGLLLCGLCRRRMQGSWNNGKPHYRCVYPTEYGLANHVQHPRSVYLREEQIVPRLDAWLAGAFAPDRLAVTVQTLVDAQADEHNESNAARIADAKRIIADCDHRLARYRAAR